MKLFFTLFLSVFLSSNLFSQQIFGEDSLCNGSVRDYWVNMSSNIHQVHWTIPLIGGSILEYSPQSDSIQVQWNSNVDRTLEVVITYNDGTPTTTIQRIIHLFQRPQPAILSSFNGGCGEIEVKGENVILPFPSSQGIPSLPIPVFQTCQVVCENTPIRYFAVGLAGSSFTWNVTGIGASMTTYPNGDSVDIIFSAGDYSVFLEETSAQGCTDNVVFCVEVIEKPEAIITSLLPISNDTIYVCKNQSITFIDSSIAHGTSAITSNTWYIYDYINEMWFSDDNEADYTFSTGGEYQIILEVLNECGCSDRDTLNIFVYDSKGPIIDACICPKCENDTTLFTTPSHCLNYSWTSFGGSVLPIQNNDSVSIVWNQSTNGYATVSLYCPDFDCPVPTMVSFPIISDNPEIQGLETICKASSDKTYAYAVPFWQGVNYDWHISPYISPSLFGPYAGQSTNNINLEILAANTTTQYTIWVEYEHPLVGCVGSDTIIVDILPQITISGENILCVGQEYKWLSVPSSNATNYSWSVDGFPNSSYTGDSLLHTFNASGFHVISLSHPDYCNTAVLPINALDVPPPPASLTGETDVCLNFAYTYNATVTSGDYYIEWLVIDGQDTILDEGSSITVQWNDPIGPYTIEARQIYNNGSCPSLPLELDAFPYNPPTPIFNAPDTVCSNSTTTLFITNIDRLIFSEWEAIGSNSNLASFVLEEDTLAEILWSNTPVGSYNTLTIKYSATICNQNYVLTKNIVIAPPPAANIIISGGNCPNTPLTFTQSNTSITSGDYNWDFGDGNTSILETPQHSYSPGTYFVNLTINNPNGCLQTVSATETVNIYDKPIAGASIWFDTSNYCLPVNVGDINPTLIRTSQLNPSYTYYWYCSGTNPTPTLADIIPSTINSSTYTVDCFGAYTNATNLYTGIIAIDTNNCWAYDSILLNIESCGGNGTIYCDNPPPIQLNIGFERYCDSVQFRDTIVGDPAYVISSSWSFDVNHYPYGSIAHDPSYVYEQSGLYHPYFQIYFYNLDSLGNIDSANTCSMRETLNLPIPMIVDFETRYQCNAAGNIEIEWLDLTDFVAYTTAGEGTNITATTWTITDINGNSNTYTPTTLPLTLAGGSYYVTLTQQATFVNNNLGINVTDTCSFADSIFVPTPATANFEIDTNIVCEKNAVFFTDLSTPQSNINSWFWDFDDNSSSLLQNPAKEWGNGVSLSSDLYSVSLEITDLYGCSNISNKSVLVYNNNLGGELTDTTSCGAAVISFGYNDLINSVPYYYHWSTDSTTIHPENYMITHQTGFYWLQIADQHGCTKNIDGVSVDIPNTPAATILGPRFVCYYEDFTLSGPGGENLHYQWEVLLGATWSSAPGNNHLQYYTHTNLDFNGATQKYRLILTYTDPETGISCEEISETLEIELLASLPNPYIDLVSSPCSLPFYLQLQDQSLANEYVIIWGNGIANTPIIEANHFGNYQVSLQDSFGCSAHEDIDVVGPYPFYELPTGCYEICDYDLPLNLHVDENFGAWDWIVNNDTLSSGTNSEPHFTITPAMAAYNMPIEIVLSVKENIDGFLCTHYSDTIFLSIDSCNNCDQFNPIAFINDTSFCQGDDIVADLFWGHFQYFHGFIHYVNGVEISTTLIQDTNNLMNGMDTIHLNNGELANSLGLNTYCLILANDTMLSCVDTVCFDYVVNSCTVGCDSLNMHPAISYHIDSGFITVTDVSTGIYELIEITYNGQSYTGLPNSTTQFAITDYATYDLCITTVAFIEDQCCKQTKCYPIEFSCDRLNLHSNFTQTNAFGTYYFNYTGNQVPTVLLWTFPDGTQITDNVQNNPSILSPSWFDANNAGGEVCLKTIIHLNDSICCAADTCFKLEQNPLKPCEQLQSFLDFSATFEDFDYYYNVTFEPILAFQGNYIYLDHEWYIDGNTYYNWSEVVKIECKEDPYYIEVCLVMTYYDPISGEKCDIKVCKEIEIPVCSIYNYKPKMYPNPANNKITLDMQKLDLEEAYYKIYDNRGKEIYSNQIEQSKSTIDLSKWASGMYKIIITTKEKQFIDKFVKN